jgi:hypothetical protein
MGQQQITTRRDLYYAQARKGQRPRLMRISQNACYDRKTRETVWLGSAGTKPGHALTWEEWANMPA